MYGNIPLQSVDTAEKSLTKLNGVYQLLIKRVFRRGETASDLWSKAVDEKMNRVTFFISEHLSSNKNFQTEFIRLETQICRLLLFN